MNDPLPMRPVQRVRNLDAVAQRLLERQRASCQSVRQWLALQVLHDEVFGLAFPSHVIERADVRVRELRDGSGLPLEALPLLRGIALLRQDFDCHGPAQARVACLVHLAHPARADWGKDLVRPEASADSQGHRLCRLYRARQMRGLCWCGSLRLGVRSPHLPPVQFEPGRTFPRAKELPGTMDAPRWS